MGNTIAISTQKGGVGKTTTAVNLSTGLARAGKRVLALDSDPQHSLTVSFGIKEPDRLPVTLTSVIERIINNEYIDPTAGIVHHAEGVDFIPANIKLAETELALVPILGREHIIRRYIETVKPFYDYIIVDTPPSLGLLTANALTAADSVIIPIIPKYLDAKGLELLLKTIANVRRYTNPNLQIGGILLTMVDNRANFTKDVITMIEEAYGRNIRIFDERIPLSVRAAETSAEGVSIFKHDPRGKVAAAYELFVQGVAGVA